MLAAPSQQRVVVSRWEMPSPRPRAKPLKWRNNQRSEYVRMPSRLALLIVCWLCIYICWQLFQRLKLSWHLRSEDNSWIYCVLAMSNVLCQVVPCILYCNRWAEMQPPTLEMSLLGNLGMPQSRWCSCFGSTEHPYSSQQTGCSPNPLLLHAEQRHKPQKDHNHRP